MKKQSDKTKPHYRVVMFYPRAHQLTFASEADARRFIEARALTKRTGCYTELWKMTNEEDGEHVGTFDYGSYKPIPLVRAD